MATTRLLTVDDAPVLSVLLRRSRAFLAPWQPLRPDSFYTLEGQQESVAQALLQHDVGNSLPLVIVDHRAQVVGTISLQSIIRGAFQSCSVGYWLAENAQGQGLATDALREAVHLAFHDLHLHRVQAETPGAQPPVAAGARPAGLRPVRPGAGLPQDRRAVARQPALPTPHAGTRARLSAWSESQFGIGDWDETVGRAHAADPMQTLQSRPVDDLTSARTVDRDRQR